MGQSSFGAKRRRSGVLPPRLLGRATLISPSNIPLPRTPYPKATGDCSQSTSSEEQVPKKSKLMDVPELPCDAARPRAIARPIEAYHGVLQNSIIPPGALTMAWKSILEQVDWTMVAQVAGTEQKPQAFCETFDSLVRGAIERCTGEDACNFSPEASPDGRFACSEEEYWDGYGAGSQRGGNSEDDYDDINDLLAGPLEGI